MTSPQKHILNKNRYRLYREHKYLFYVLSELLQLVSTLNFSIKESRNELRNQLNKISSLFQSHAEHEESRIHFILRNKCSPIFHEAEEHHHEQKLYFEGLDKKLDLIDSVSNTDDIHFHGYEFYLI